MCEKGYNEATSKPTTLRDRLQETIRHGKEARVRMENEMIQAEKALAMLDKNKELETLINLLGR